MKTFIKDYKNSQYYKKLFEVKEDIIIAYVGGSYSFRTNHEASDYDINIITNGGKFFTIYYDWHLKYKHKKVHWYYRPIEDFFESICYDLIDYIGLLTLIHIPQENIIYLNPKYENYWNWFYSNRKELLRHICIELGLSCKNFIKTILESESISTKVAQRVYFTCIAAYEFLNKEPNIVLLRNISKAKRPGNNLNSLEISELKALLNTFLNEIKAFNLYENRAKLKDFKNKFNFSAAGL